MSPLARKIDGVDLAPHLTRQAALVQQRADIATARERAIARREEIARVRLDLAQRRPSGAAVAEALLAGGEVSTMPFDERQLAAELDALGAAIANLDHREREIEPAIETERVAVISAMSERLADDVAEMRDEARLLAEKLAAVFALAALLNSSTRCPRAGALRRDLEPALAKLGSAGLVDRVEAPARLVDELRSSRTVAFVRGNVPGTIDARRLDDGTPGAVQAAIAATIARGIG